LPQPVRARNMNESTVATLNLHLFYDTINDPGGDDVATALEYANKLNKLSLYIRTLLGAPDILAVQEAEKLGVLQDLANKINTDDAALVYTPYLIEGNDVGGIDAGFLVRNTVAVNAVTQLGKTDIFTFDGSLLHDRPPLLLDANLANGTAISVLCVHQRSLNGIDDPVDGNRVRLKRQTQADSVARMVQRLQNSNPFINLVVTGDFNAFQFTDGYVDVLGQIMGTPSNASQALIPGTDEVNPDLVNKVLALPAAEQYSFNFGGSAQVLDHALVSQTLNPAITGVAYARGNSDAAENFESDGATPLRASDHDGLVLYITPIPVNAAAGDDREICFGQSTKLGGDPTGSGGTGTLTFNWTPVDGLDDPSAANPIASPLATTTYTVTVTDANNSKATDQVTVTVNPLPLVEAGDDIAICVGQTVTIGGNPTGSGGNGDLTFSWTPTLGLNDPTSPNPKARPVATTKYIVTATDTKGCSAKDSLTVTVHDAVFLANEYIHFHGPRTSEGNLHANSTINFHVGRPSLLKGNLTAVNEILIRAKNTVDGDATAGKRVTLLGNAKVTGTVNVAPVPQIPLPVFSFNAGGKPITVGQNKSFTLPPGAYGEVKVLNGGKLFLTSGEYFMGKFELNSSTVLTCNVAAGPITVYIVDNFKFGQKAKVVITPAGAMASAQVGFITLTKAGIEIGVNSLVRGAIIAPNAMVTLQKDSRFKGSICAGKIDVHNGASFFHHSSASLSKSAEEFEIEESEVTSEQSPVTNYELAQNYPNPFSQIPRFAGNPSTKIQFSVLEAGVVQLSVYNLQGQEVRTLVSGQMNPGRHAITWNGRDNAGKVVPSGVYLYKLRVNGFEETRKMTFMK
jgi:cytoskeletal protein CcmA (bactofilin family)